MKKYLALLMALAFCLCFLAGCSYPGDRESDIVSRNVSKEADNFNVTRRITVFNIRTDTVLMQMTGRIALKNEGHDELSVLVEIEKGVYQKHFIYLNDYTMYTVEDLSGANVSPYTYEMEFLPQKLQPVRITTTELREDIVGLERTP